MVAEQGATGAAMEAALAALQSDVTSLRSTLATYEKTVKEEITSVAGGLRDLCGKADIAIVNLELRVQSLEQQKPAATDNRTLLNAKDMKPSVLTKDEDWRRWKSDIEDYAEEMFHGMKEVLDTARASEMEITETWFEATHEHWWNKAEMFYRFLKRYTGTEARRIVLGMSDDNS